MFDPGFVISGKHGIALSILSTLVVVPLMMTSIPIAQADPIGQSCKDKLTTVQQLDVVATFGQLSGVADFIDAVKESTIGRDLAACPTLADDVWSIILAAVRQEVAPSVQVQLRTALLLVPYAESLNRSQLALQIDNLKEFVKHRPWRQGGFLFASSIAVDALLAYKDDPARDVQFHSYTNEEMEAAFRKYVKHVK